MRDRYAAVSGWIGVATRTSVDGADATSFPASPVLRYLTVNVLAPVSPFDVCSIDSSAVGQLSLPHGRLLIKGRWFPQAGITATACRPSCYATVKRRRSTD